MASPLESNQKRGRKQQQQQQTKPHANGVDLFRISARGGIRSNTAPVKKSSDVLSPYLSDAQSGDFSADFWDTRETVLTKTTTHQTTNHPPGTASKQRNEQDFPSHCFSVDEEQDDSHDDDDDDVWKDVINRKNNNNNNNTNNNDDDKEKKGNSRKKKSQPFHNAGSSDSFESIFKKSLKRRVSCRSSLVAPTKIVHNNNNDKYQSTTDKNHEHRRRRKRRASTQKKVVDSLWASPFDEDENGPCSSSPLCGTAEPTKKGFRSALRKKESKTIDLLLRGAANSFHWSKKNKNTTTKKDNNNAIIFGNNKIDAKKEQQKRKQHQQRKPQRKKTAATKNNPAIIPLSKLTSSAAHDDDDDQEKESDYHDPSTENDDDFSTETEEEELDDDDDLYVEEIDESESNVDHHHTCLTEITASHHNNHNNRNMLRDSIYRKLHERKSIRDIVSEELAIVAVTLSEEFSIETDQEEDDELNENSSFSDVSSDSLESDDDDEHHHQENENESKESEKEQEKNANKNKKRINKKEQTNLTKTVTMKSASFLGINSSSGKPNGATTTTAITRKNPKKIAKRDVLRALNKTQKKQQRKSITLQHPPTSKAAKSKTKTKTKQSMAAASSKKNKVKNKTSNTSSAMTSNTTTISKFDNMSPKEVIMYFDSSHSGKSLDEKETVCSKIPLPFRNHALVQLSHDEEKYQCLDSEDLVLQESPPSPSSLTDDHKLHDSRSLSMAKTNSSSAQSSSRCDKGKSPGRGSKSPKGRLPAALGGGGSRRTSHSPDNNNSKKNDTGKSTTTNPHRRLSLSPISGRRKSQKNSTKDYKASSPILSTRRRSLSFSEIDHIKSNTSVWAHLLSGVEALSSNIFPQKGERQDDDDDDDQSIELKAMPQSALDLNGVTMSSWDGSIDSRTKKASGDSGQQYHRSFPSPQSQRKQKQKDSLQKRPARSHGSQKGTHEAPSPKTRSHSHGHHRKTSSKSSSLSPKSHRQRKVVGRPSSFEDEIKTQGASLSSLPDHRRQEVTSMSNHTASSQEKQHRRRATDLGRVSNHSSASSDQQRQRRAKEIGLTSNQSGTSTSDQKRHPRPTKIGSTSNHSATSSDQRDQQKATELGSTSNPGAASVNQKLQRKAADMLPRSSDHYKASPLQEAKDFPTEVKLQQKVTTGIPNTSSHSPRPESKKNNGLETIKTCENCTPSPSNCGNESALSVSENPTNPSSIFEKPGKVQRCKIIPNQELSNKRAVGLRLCRKSLSPKQLSMLIHRDPFVKTTVDQIATRITARNARVRKHQMDKNRKVAPLKMRATMATTTVLHTMGNGMDDDETDLDGHNESLASISESALPICTNKSSVKTRISLSPVKIKGRHRKTKTTSETAAALDILDSAPDFEMGRAGMS